MERNDRARAAASHTPGSAGAEPVNLADRRRAVAERLFRKQCDDTIALLEVRARIVERIEQLNGLIEASKRAHPSSGRVYDHQKEEPS